MFFENIFFKFLMTEINRLKMGVDATSLITVYIHAEGGANQWNAAANEAAVVIIKIHSIHRHSYMYRNLWHWRVHIYHHGTITLTSLNWTLLFKSSSFIDQWSMTTLILPTPASSIFPKFPLASSGSSYSIIYLVYSVYTACFHNSYPFHFIIHYRTYSITV